MMRVFVAGASGALGSRLVPQLIDAGHEVIGTYHSPSSAELVRTLISALRVKERFPIGSPTSDPRPRSTRYEQLR
jgi:nucleoside-diphosphate-sugar epimerase